MEDEDEAIYFNPEEAEDKEILDVTLRESEYAPSLTKVLAQRGNLNALNRIHLHYSSKPLYPHVVSAIENGLSTNEKKEGILMQLSRTLKEKEGEMDIVRFSRHMANRSEGAARKLSTYLSYLGISDNGASKLLHQKKLLLIGGGIGPIKRELLERNINCRVTNVDPMLSGGEKGIDNADVCYDKNFFDLDLREEYDEVWSANNSLPTYALTPKQVRDFYRKSLALTTTGGTLRVLPTHGFCDAITPSMRLSRVPVNNESIRCLDEIAESELFEVTRFQTPILKSFFGNQKRMEGASIYIGEVKDKVARFLNGF